MLGYFGRGALTISGHNTDIKEATEKSHVNSRQCISKHWLRMTIGITFVFVLIIGK